MGIVRSTRFFLVLLLAGLAVLPRPVHAAVGGCISDPYVVLSNGEIMHLDAVLPDSTPADIQSITYTLDLPKGTTVVLEVTTDGVIGLSERFQYLATNPDGVYDATTFVQTATTGAPVTATASVGLASASITGVVDQPLSIELYG